MRNLGFPARSKYVREFELKTPDQSELRSAQDVLIA